MPSLIHQDQNRIQTDIKTPADDNAREGKDMNVGRLLRDRIFSDMMNAPGSICAQEVSSRHISTRSSTLFNIVMQLDRQSPHAEVVWGQPGSGKEGDVIHLPWDD